MRNPVTAAFFESETLGNQADVLVREAIQNSLDARASAGAPVRVRIYLSLQSGALSPTDMARWTPGLRRHLQIPGSGAREVPTETAYCPFLVYEDFGTTGLTGDPQRYQAESDETEKNNFFSFFRAEAFSEKEASEGGIWGVGKTVFLGTSDINTFFGLSSTEDGQLLLGRCVLRYHTLDSQPYTSDGYFGMRRDDGLVLPVDEASSHRDLLDQFVSDFQILRTADEPGLSIVVPWYPHGEGTQFSTRALEAAIVKSYFWPIIRGDLTVTLESPRESIHIDSVSIVERLTDLDQPLRAQMEAVVDLAQWAHSCQENPTGEGCQLEVDFAVGAAAPQWTAEALPDEVRAAIAVTLEDHERVSLRVFMNVLPKNADAQKTWFDIFLEGTAEKEQPVFLRDLLRIQEEPKSPRKVGSVRAIVLVQDQPLASFLRAAEMPAHDRWDTNSQRLKQKYRHSEATLRFVRNSVRVVAEQSLRAAMSAPDPLPTHEFFAEVAPTGPPASGAKDDGRSESTKMKKPNLPRPKRSVRAEKSGSSVVLGPGEERPDVGAMIHITFAYDVRSGDPVKRYRKYDFSFTGPASPITLSLNGVEEIARGPNTLRLKVINEDFQVRADGFDENRDLFVRTISSEATR